MTTPISGPISMSDLNNEVDYITPAGNLQLKTVFYNTANTGGGIGLQYHNLNMASNNTTSAKVAIYDPLTANANMSISNWYNYTRDVGMVMTYLITNNSSYGVEMYLDIWDTSDTSQGNIFSGSIPANSNTGTQTVDTGLTTQFGSMPSGYRIAVENITFQPPPGPGQTFSVTLSTVSATDTDAVGAGVVRTTYSLGSYSESGPPIPPPPPWTPTKCVDSSGSLIFVNKRTTVSIEIN